MRRYYEHIREGDLVLTHSLINLQRSRNVSGLYNLEEGTALHCVRETDAGSSYAAHACWPRSAPSPTRSRSIRRVFPFTRMAHNPFALNFAIPCSTKGLRFLCRDSFDQGRSHFDYPLSSRFDEMDCVVFFDDVLVPWERVFLLGDVELLNKTGAATNFSAHSAHQGAAKNLAKCEFVLGVALLMTETLGNAQVPHTESYIGELMLTTSLMKACIRGAEADAKLDRWGVMCPDPVMIESTRNLFMTAYPRMIEILHLLGSSSFMITPSKADLDSPLSADIEQYLATDKSTAHDRVRLFRLASDLAISSFGNRQVLYERFYASDPLSRARALAAIYPKSEAMQRVLDFLKRDDA